jgi:Tfp pilus assembly protein PilF
MTLQQAMQWAMQQHQAGNLEQAQTVYRMVLQQEPQNADALHLLGVLQHQSGRHDEAIQLIQKALAIHPNAYEFHTNLAMVLRALQRYEEAAAAYQRALVLQADNADLWYNLSSVLGMLARWNESLAASRQAIALKADFAAAHWNCALALLVMGEFAQGWEEYEWRLAISNRALDRRFLQPQWDGADPAGKTILLHTEGGFGDALHFIRYVPMLQGNRAKLILECQPRLVSLVSQIAGLDRLIPRGEPLPHFDLHVPLPSLPRIFRTQLDNIPASVPYLKAPDERVRQWTARVPHDRSLNVALTWAGSDHGSGLEVRSRSLSAFAPLARVSGVRFFSLQTGPDAAQVRPAGMELIDFTPDLQDFADTAAFLMHMDLLISVDTSPVHLAGALGRPVWVLLPLQNDFRWLLDRTDSPWYPTLRLFRQTKLGDWHTPVGQMAQALEGLIK